MLQPSILKSFLLRTIKSDCVNFCKIKKCSLFIHFFPRNTYISECKIVHLYTIATVTVHICTVTITCVFNILIIFSFSLSLLSPHSLFFSFALTLTSLPFPHASIATGQTMPPLPPIIKPSLSPLSLFLMPPLPLIKPCLHCRRSPNPYSPFSSFDQII